MAKYHTNPKTGNPGICRAEKNCPFGDEAHHYSSREEAAQAYEKTMKGKSAGSKNSYLRADDFELDSKIVMARNLYETELKQQLRSKSDQKLLDDVFAFKKVDDGRLDEFLEYQCELAVVPSREGSRSHENWGKVFEVLRSAKAVDGRVVGDTLTTVANFDPASESVFSNGEARQNPFVAVKALNRENKHGEWLRTLALGDSETLTLPDLSEDERFFTQQQRIQREYAAQWSDARQAAMLMEMKYCYQTDSAFKKIADERSRDFMGALERDRSGFSNEQDYVGKIYPIK